jgi:TPR repeat protein
MWNKLKLLLPIILLLSSTYVCAENFSDTLTKKGMEAYRSGDIKEAVKWLELAAEEENIAAMVELAFIYHSEKNYKSALKWAYAGAEYNDSEAFWFIGVMHEMSQGVKKDLDEALKWYFLSSSVGKVESAYSIGKIYQSDIKQDYQTAIKWFKIAAEKGHTRAKYELGYMFYDGLGVEKNYKTAASWYQLAAEVGSVDSQFNLAIMHYHGQGVIKSNVLSYMWFDILSKTGDENAKERKKFVAQQMTQKQIAEAQKLARECVAKDYKGC